ncbi:MAG TPA: CdaR family protein [Anaerolineae bacterium]|nr:CdaR family protein [Anaerolineae bacterium]HQM13254.1 CdaR family protein [Anaerolineae bacterium]
MGHRLGQTLSLAALSLVLAFFFWAVATETSDPTEERAYADAIPIEVRGVPEDRMAAYGAENSKARVVLRAPHSIWQILQTEDIHAYVDLSAASPGKNISVPVIVEVLRGPAQVVEYSPQEITLSLEPLVEKDVPVLVVIDGTPALGYVARPPTYVPQAVTVRGPESRVAEVVRAQLRISVKEQRQNVTGDLAAQPVDQAGNVVAYVEIIPQRISVSVPIEQLGNIRDMAVRVIVLGEPAEGYRVASVTVDPPIVTVIGRQDVIQQLSGYLDTDPVLLNGASASFTATVGLQLPEGLSALLTPEVLVEVTLEMQESKLTVPAEPEVLGLPTGYSVELQPARLRLVLAGPYTAIKDLNIDTVKVSVDVDGLAPGRHTLTPTITLPDPLIRIENVLPQPTLSVMIRRELEP